MKVYWERLPHIKGRDSRFSFDLGIRWYNSNGKAFVIDLFRWRLVMEIKE